MKYRFDSFIKESEIRVKTTYDYISKPSNNNANLKNCISFIDNIIHATSSQNLTGMAGKLFSSIDAKLELENSLNLAAICSYKSSIDSLRRALEIIFIGCYFDLIMNESMDVFEWLNSNKDTPFFSTVKKELFKKGNFRKFKEEFKWDNEVQNLFWELSDYSHTKGYSKSINFINKTKGFSHAPQFDKESLDYVLELFIKVVRAIATNLALSNPILLLGLPVEEKLGLNSGLGLFNVKQAKLLNDVLPENFKKKITEIINDDNAIKERVLKIKSLPDNMEYQKILELLK